MRGGLKSGCWRDSIIGSFALALCGAAAATDDSSWDGALGLIAGHGPAYAGASDGKNSLKPAFYLRRGRISLSSGGGFVTRRSEDVVRGLGIDLVERRSWRVSLGLRYDTGRSDSASPALAGLGGVKSTLRARIAALWRLEQHWQLGASWSVDAFGRGGGNYGELKVQRDLPLSPATTLQVGATLALAGDRYMQTYHGISAEQAARTGYPVYTPGFGWRDVALNLGLRSDLSRHWVALGGLSVSHLLGPAAQSPLTRRTTGVGVSAGIAYVF